MNGVMELGSCGSRSWRGPGHSLELLILWDMPCTVPVSSFPGCLVTRDTTHPPEAASRVPSAALPQQLLNTSGQLPPYNPLQLHPAGFSTGKRLLGKGLKGFSVIPTPATSSQILFYQSTLLHTMDPLLASQHSLTEQEQDSLPQPHSLHSPKPPSPALTSS